MIIQDMKYLSHRQWVMTLKEKAICRAPTLGALMHQVTLDYNRRAEYRVVTPTGWQIGINSIIALSNWKPK